MAQFDVHKDRKRGRYPLLLDIQVDLLRHLDTRIVVPLARKRGYPAKPMQRVNPIVVVRGTEYVAVFQELAAILVTELGELVGSLAAVRPELITAIDFMITGS
ncbi:CcdB family protein [soil metagenome]